MRKTRATPDKGSLGKIRKAYQIQASRVRDDLLAAGNPTLDPKTPAGKDVLKLLGEGFGRLAAQKKRQFEGMAKGRRPQVTRVRTTGPLDAILKGNVALIKSLSTKAAEDLRELLGANHGANRDQLTAIIQERFGVTKSRAEFWAVDQTLKANAELALHEARANGFTHYRWSTSKDSRVRRDDEGKGRPDHVHLEGTVQSLSLAPVVEEATGRRCHPGQDYRCRCVMVPLFPDEVPGNAPKPKPPPKPPKPKALPKPPRVVPAPQPPAPIVVEPVQRPLRSAPVVDGAPTWAVESVAVHESTPIAAASLGSATTQQATRKGIRDVIRHVHPGMQSRDISRENRVGRDGILLRAQRAGVGGTHSFETGTTSVSPELQSDFSAWQRKAAAGEWKQITETEWKSFHVMTHEEIHGFSAITSDAYIPGHASANIEEVLTEVLARSVTRDVRNATLGEQIPIMGHRAPSDRNYSLTGPMQIGIHPPVGSYGDLIWDVLNALDFDGPLLESIAVKMRGARVGAKPNATPMDQINEFLGHLPAKVRASAEAKLRKAWKFDVASV